MRVSGIVLAGGRSTRFGRDKLLEPVHDEPLLWLPIRALGQVCTEVLVATAPGRAYPLPAHVRPPIRFVEDQGEGGGPMAGVRAALAHAAHPVALVVGGDMPTLAVGDLRRLADAVRSGAGAASLGQPLPCALDVAEARSAIAETEPSAVRQLLTALDAAVLEPSDRATLRDVDEPGDLPPA